MIDDRDEQPGQVLLAVVDPPLLRAAIVHATRAGHAALWRLDAGPLTLSTITGGPGSWRLRSLRSALPTPDDELVDPAAAATHPSGAAAQRRRR